MEKRIVKVEIKECPNCGHTRIKKLTNKSMICEDCGHIWED